MIVLQIALGIVLGFFALCATFYGLYKLLEVAVHFENKKRLRRTSQKHFTSSNYPNLP